MSSKIFLQALQSKLKGGNSRSIHLNALPGRFATRLDLKQLDLIDEGLSQKFLQILLNKSSFEFGISFDSLDLNKYDQIEQKKLGLISKRLNSIIIENEDYFKEHGTKTLGFGYPILIRRSSKDPSKIIKAPLFIWPLDAVKSKNKVNEWTLFRNKVLLPNGKLAETDIHGVNINEVLLSFIKGEDDILLPGLNPEIMDDMLVDQAELLSACASVLSSLNSGLEHQHLLVLEQKFLEPINALPDSASVDTIANSKAYIHFGGVFGLFRAQKESIITDITKLLDRFEEFDFDNLKVESLSDTPFSAVNTDPTQQAIISTLALENNQIIQGPPGTGKSQSLTALVTNALANGLKCLVVCEKKTALDVIKRNIERTNEEMAQLVAVIDDVNEDREAIIDSVRERQNNKPNLYNASQVASHYRSYREKLNTVTESINSQHLALFTSIYDNRNWSQLVGRFLALRKKFIDIPLRYDLEKDNFKFSKDTNELKTLLSCLGKANNLYLSAAAYCEVFKLLNENIFNQNTFGEARVILEDLVLNIKNSSAEIQITIDNRQKLGEGTANRLYEELPKYIYDELSPHIDYIIGTNLSVSYFPQEFPLEKEIKETIINLQKLSEEAEQLKITYSNQLKNYFNEYHQSLNSEIKSYLNFIDKYLSEHGDSFLSNSVFEKLKTNLLSVFSKKHKLLKGARVEVVSRIADIRTIQQSKNYISHEYNDQIESSDLNIFPDNIRALNQKLNQWYENTPAEIKNYLDEISKTHFHPECMVIKSSIFKILNTYEYLTSNLVTKDLIENNISIEEINNLINDIPGIILKLGEHLSVFEKNRIDHQELTKQYDTLNSSILSITKQQNIDICHNPYQSGKSLEFARNCLSILSDFANSLGENIQHFRSFFDWKSFYLSCEKREQDLFDTMISKTEGSWEERFECWYLFWILTQNEPQQLPKSDYEIQLYKSSKVEFDGSQLNNIISKWCDRQNSAVKMLKSKGQGINSLFNKKGAKGMRRNSLRTIVKNEFELFTDFFPVVLLNPSVCSSIIPLEEGIFDLVIFDEASQLRLEDTYAALVRGKAKIVSGDKHQMAPSSYFEGSGALLDPIEDEIENEDDIDIINAGNRSDLSLADSESLLAYAVDKNFKESYLTVHYRSQHPYLIDFSNHAFYGKRLIPVPAKKEYIPIEFRQINGIYENSTNRSEALSVISILKNNIFANSDGSYPSVGVATFNLYQRNLILEEIGAERRVSPDFDNLIGALGNSFFVKNLENIQGDERDIIIISTTFGNKPNGTFSQNFGPIIQGKGHRMLNVIITRAKVKVYICCSFSENYITQYPQLIQHKGNKGRGVLYAYLAYAKSVSENNEDQRLSILNLLSQYCTDQHYDHSDSILGSESPFEDEVYSRLIAHIDPKRVEQQFKVGGFRIDIVIHPETANGRKIAIECDGAKYHNSPEAYAWDIFRQQQLENFGFEFHRIWSTKWWDSAEKEIESLLEFIKSDTSVYENEHISLEADNRDNFNI